LPEADAFLVVTSYESPLSEGEIRFFKVGYGSTRRIFVILNKHDIVTPNERSEAITFVRNRLQALFGQQIPQIFSVSAREGLDAKRNRDRPRLVASGIPALEDELIKFLLAEKQRDATRRFLESRRARAFSDCRRPECQWRMILEGGAAEGLSIGNRSFATSVLGTSSIGPRHQ